MNEPNTVLTSLDYKPSLPKEGEVGWRSPSNIALIKYWGKRKEQLPQNPSISLTLKNAYTETTVRYLRANGSSPGIEFYLDGLRNEAFEVRVKSYIQRISKILTFLKDYHLRIESTNSFPHSTGIASSASGMSALALCLCQIEKSMCTVEIREEEFYKRASYISRLGSGSACRSVYGPAALWGVTAGRGDSSDYYAISVTDMHPVYSTFHDDIVIVSSDKKSVSSSAGHDLMTHHFFSDRRFDQARENINELMTHLKSGNLHEFGRIVEQEALTLHAMMMCSDPSYILMKPETLTVIDEIKAFRERSGIPIYFTLDAGPNVHVLYPDEFMDQVSAFFSERVIPHAESGKIIRDIIGHGPLPIG